MDARVLFFCIIVAITSESQGQSTQTFLIDKLWNGTDLAVGTNITLTLTGVAESKDLTLEITAPFFDDPAPTVPPHEPFVKLWLYEVVEAFFVNHDKQYLQLEISPYGQHLVLLLNGYRNEVRHSLSLSVNTSITGDIWTGTVVIPGDYFPPKVTKFNAHAMHGTGDRREYWSLYPSGSSVTKPDFHALLFDNFIDYASISPLLESNPLSSLWENALKSAIKYTIDKTWNGQPIEVDFPVTLILTKGSNPSELVVNITAPFFADPPPNGTPGQPFLGLWNYEVVELFFLNDQNQYLEVEIGPFGHHIILLLSGVRNTIRHSLSLNVSTDSGRHIWQGTAIIPGDYLPPNVTRFNAYAIHGPLTQRVYWALYPTDGSTESPDFHNLNFFKAIDLDSIFQANVQNAPSPLWDAALQGIIRYESNSQWNGRTSTVGSILTTLQGFQGGVELNFTVSSNVQFMPLKYATFIFKNGKGESLKLIMLPTENHSMFLSNAKNVLLQESSPMDFRVVANDEIINGSVLIPPEYFPPNVTLINIYFTFGISVLEVISLQPSVITDSHINVTASLEEPVHFAKIDFETVIENNLVYSSKWQALVPTTTSTESENTSEATPSEVSTTNSSDTEFDIGAVAKDSASNPTEVTNEGVKKLLAEIQADKHDITESKIEGQLEVIKKGVNKLLAEIEADNLASTAVKDFMDATAKGDDKIDQEAEKVTVTNSKVHDVKVAGAEVKEDQEKVKTTGVKVNAEGQVEIASADVSKDEEQEVKAAGAEVMINFGQKEVVGSGSEVKNNKGQEKIKVTSTEVKKDEEQVEEKMTEIEADNLASTTVKDFMDTTAKGDDKIDQEAEKVTVTNSKVHVVKVAGAEVKEDQEKVKTTGVKVKAEGQVEIASADVAKDEYQEVKAAGAEVMINFGQKEVVGSGSEVKNNEGQEKIKVTSTEVKKDEEQVEEKMAEIEADNLASTTVKDFMDATAKGDDKIDQEAEKVTVTNSKVHDVKVAGAEVKEDQEKVKTTGVKVKAEGQVEIASADVAKDEYQEVKAAGAEVMINFGQKEVVGSGSEVKNNEGQEKIKVTSTEVKKDEEQVEEKVTVAQVKKDEGLEKVPVEVADIKDDSLNIMDEILEEVMEEDAGVGNGGLDAKDIVQDAVFFEENEFPSEFLAATTTEKEEDVDLNLPSNREESQRRIEGEILDRNVFHIPFKISVVSQNENVKGSDHDVPLPELSTPRSKTIQESDIEDTVDRLIDILNSGPPQSALGQGLLPPPHPICFTPGLVADNFRCQVFYECVMEDGRWEVYNWRCKRGYFFDEEKIACVRGYC